MKWRGVIKIGSRLFPAILISAFLLAAFTAAIKAGAVEDNSLLDNIPASIPQKAGNSTPAASVKAQAELAAEIQVMLEQNKVMIKQGKDLARAADDLGTLIAKSFRLENPEQQKRVACEIFLWLGIAEVKRGNPESAIDEFWNMFNCSYQDAKLLTKSLDEKEVISLIQKAEGTFLARPSATEANQYPALLSDINVTSEPEGTSVIIDDKLVGLTPITIKILAGTHRLRLVKPNYQGIEDILDVPAGLTANRHYVLPALWPKFYFSAEQAISAGKWDEAIKYLNEAIKLKSDSSAWVSFAGGGTPYYPYFKLGIAYYNLGQLDAALQALSTEKQLGAIAQSAGDNAELQRIFDLATKAKQLGASEEYKQIKLLLSDYTSQASKLDTPGQLDQALVAVSKALALSQENAEARAVLQRLQSKIIQVEQEFRIADIIAEGRSLTAAGDYQLASIKLAEAQSIKDNGDVKILLEQARAKLLTQVEASQIISNRPWFIEDVLRKTKKLSTTKKVRDALLELQRAVVLDPSNNEVKNLQQSLLAEIIKSEEGSFWKERVGIHIALGLRAFRLGNYEESLQNANHALALEPENCLALSLTVRGYRALKERLLGKVYVSFPPRIFLIDSQDYELGKGVKAELVHESRYKFSGTVYSDFPIDLAIEIGLDNSKAVNRLLQAQTNREKQNEGYITQFVVQPVLKQGLSIISVVARDPILGTDMPRPYMVYYAPPFYRTAWFYLALIGLLIAAGAGAYGVNRHRNNRLFKRRFNPYVAGAPVLQDDLFMGREQLLKNILQTIHNNSIMLFGERRIGKTSVQHHLKKRLEQLTDPDYIFYGVFIDLQGIPQELFFITLGEEIVREFTPALERAHISLAVLHGSEYDYRELVEDIRQVLKALAVGTNKKIKLVLLIDEVDQLNSYDPRVNQRLRSLFMRNFSENLAAVVSGVSIKKHWDGEGSPWYNFFEEIEVKPFRHEDAKDLIERPIRGIFKLEKGVTDRIIEITECRPYLIQKMCISLINRMHEEHRRMVTLADVDSVGRPKET